MDKIYPLITGSEGYIGNTLRSKQRCSVGYDIKRGQDILDVVSLEKTITKHKPTHIVHLAGIVGDPACKRDLEKAYRTNVVGTRNIINCCDRFDIPLIFVSTCSIYGDSGDTGEVSPISYYALSKLVSEREIRKSLRGFTILRLGTVYGVSLPRVQWGVEYNKKKNTRWELVINKMVRDGIENGKIEVWGGGQRRPFISTVGVSDLIISCMKKDVRSGVYNAVEFCERIKNVGKDLSEIIGCDLEIVDKETDGRDYVASSERIEREVGEIEDRFYSEVDNLMGLLL